MDPWVSYQEDGVSDTLREVIERDLDSRLNIFNISTVCTNLLIEILTGKLPRGPSRKRMAGKVHAKLHEGGYW